MNALSNTKDSSAPGSAREPADDENRTQVGPTSDSREGGEKSQSTSTQAASNSQVAQNAEREKTQHVITLGSIDMVTVWPDNIEKSCVLLTEMYVMIPRTYCLKTKNSVAGSGQKVTNNSSATPFLVNEEWIDKTAMAKTSSANGTKR